MGVFKMFKRVFGKKKRPSISLRPCKFVRINETFWAVPDLVMNPYGGYTPIWPKEFNGLWAAVPSKHQMHILEDLMGFNSDQSNDYTYNA